MLQSVSLKKWTRYFFSFMITLLTTLLVLCGVVMGTVFSEHYMTQRMEVTDYCDNVALVLREQYAAYGLPAGIEDSFFDTVIDQDQLYRDINRAVTASYAGESYTPDRTTMEEELYRQFEEYAQDKGVEITAETEKSLRYLSTLCIGKYVQQANHTLVRTVGQYAHSLTPYLWIEIAVLAVLDGLCWWVVYRLSSMPHRAMRSWNSGLLGAAIMLIVVPAWLYLSKGVERLGITSRSLQPLLITYANDIFVSLVICGVVIVVTVLTAGLIGVHLLKKRHAYR